MALKSFGSGIRNVGSLLTRYKLLASKVRTVPLRCHHYQPNQGSITSSLLTLSTNHDVRINHTSRTYSHHPPFPYPEIRSQKSAKQFALLLDERGRSLLLQELNQINGNKGADQTPSESPTDGATLSEEVSRRTCMDVVIFHGIPFIGFGILDNMVMIIAGEYIDVTIGMALGISTMAAAALGNLISDLAGIGTAGYVELMATKVGVRHPDLTKEQAHSWRVRWSVGLGRSLGITIGCLIGMFPLLFFENKSDEAESNKDEKTSETTTSSAS